MEIDIDMEIGIDKGMEIDIDKDIEIDMKIDIDTYLPTYLCWSTPPWHVIGWPE